MNGNRVYIDTLGCPKNFNDSEYAIGILEEEGYVKVDSPEDADFIIVNTCAFIEDAKRESIDRIFQLNNLKKRDVKLIVSGCLAERYAQELFDEMPEASGFIGVNRYSDLPSILKELNERKIFVGPCDLDYLEKTIRDYGENPYTSTIKIAEGCNNRCSYCIIPKIRGKYRSKKIEDILLEATELADKGCKELILIAQDVTYYGMDLYNKYMLPKLLKELEKIKGIEWIRLMYCYDERITDELIDVMANSKKVLPYIDIPLQHGSDKILKEMFRNSTNSSIRELIRKLRDKVPNIAIRTSLIVGFPGETDDDFKSLVDLVQDIKFERLGVFKYSQEEDTPAGERDDQIDIDIKDKRFDSIMIRQLEISLEYNKEFIGEIIDVIVDEEDDEKDNSYIGRSKWDAPEIDNSVIFTSIKKLSPGDIVKVKITDAFDYDIVGVAI